MPSDDREKQFERALAQHLRNVSPDSTCPDAETLAAYHERNLSLEELARWKEHIVGCTRCQGSLALVEKSEDVRAEEWEHQSVPVPVEETALPKVMRAGGARIHQEGVLNAARTAGAAAPVGKAVARKQWRWLVPVGALAASVIVWIGVREIRTQHDRSMESVQVAQNRPAIPETPAPSFEVRDQSKKEESPTRTLPEEDRLQSKVATASPKIMPSQKTGAAEVASAPALPANERAVTKRKDSEFSNAERVSPPQPVPPVSSYDAKREVMEVPAPPTAKVADSAGAVGGAAANAPARAKKMAELPSVTQTVTVESAAAPVNTSSAQLELKARNVAGFVEAAGGDLRYVVAPGEKNAWRVGEAGKIEHSTDRGKTWKLQKSGVAEDLTAGSATSDKVCWVVGKTGTLLLTTDSGKHWKHISSPVTEDLGGIHATDALHASIWDVPNRKSFETTDGGATWNPISNK